MPNSRDNRRLRRKRREKLERGAWRAGAARRRRRMLRRAQIIDVLRSMYGNGLAMCVALDPVRRGEPVFFAPATGAFRNDHADAFAYAVKTYPEVYSYSLPRAVLDLKDL